jgi:hypothetical protein
MSTEQKEAEATKLQEAAYGAQLAAGLPVSDLATAVLISADGTIHHRFCASYIHALQRSDWYAAAFTGYTGPVTVAGGKGRSSADAARGSVKIPTAGQIGNCVSRPAAGRAAKATITRGGSTSYSSCGRRWETKRHSD